MKRKNRCGPNIDPCGTPDSTLIISNVQLVSVSQVAFKCVRQLCIGILIYSELGHDLLYQMLWQNQNK